MPELPEVETIRRGLQIIRHKRIKQVQVLAPKIAKPKGLASLLVGHSITRLERRGKLLIAHLSNQSILLIHLKMTGQLVYRPAGGKLVVGGHPIDNVVTVPNKFTHIIVSFSNGSKLFYNDVRRFGYWRLIRPQDLSAIISDYGPEPLERSLTKEIWLDLLQHKSAWKIKKFLLDQSVIAGLGNIYADEACFLTKIRPQRTIRTISPQQRLQLLVNIRRVLRQSIKHGGTSFNNYVQAQGLPGNFSKLLKVYGRQGQLCQRCKKGRIIKTRLVGRGTHYCPQCQK
ncbi:MAG: bifunctional DNA-formamidopyrimidine glycosylase/DNA-(apurinic or apyrimidinic site) lyase [Candidatus Komeilibacteria bacterium]